MAAFFAGLFALIAGLLVGLILGMALVGFMIAASKTFRNFVVELFDKADAEDWDNI